MQHAHEQLRSDARRKRDQIVLAARALFVRHGIDVPMEEIARQAGVGKGTLYRRFPERDLLVGAVALDVYQQLADMARAASRDEPDAWSALSRFLHDWAEVRFGFLHAGMCAPLPGLLQASKELRQARDTWLGLVDQMVEGAQAEGVLRKDVGTGDLALFINLLVQQRDVPDGLTGLLPQRFLALMLDGLRTNAAAPLPGSPITSADLDTADTATG
ncbi:TetR/AcrR family transcriptional regulator [Actinomadura montaniterrae]|nr:TetR/AcrR family transcriptional regulator [Actinomadura montaniterrae]